MEITNNQEVDDNQLHNYLLPVTHVLTNFTHSEAMWALMNGNLDVMKWQWKRQFLSSKNPHFQNEAKFQTFLVIMSFIAWE